MINKLRLTDFDAGILFVRIATGGLMFLHGIHKVIHGHDAIQGMLKEKSLPAILWLGVPVCEVIAPILVILGVFTRFAGLLIALVMVASIFLAYGLQGFALTDYGGLTAELNVYFLLCGIALFLSGGGKYSVYKPTNDWLK